MSQPKEALVVPAAAEQQALEVGDYKMTADQVALIKRTIAKDCTDDELSLFVHVCRRLRLDPIAKQLYAVKYEGVMTIQIGIDGMRLIAERTGEYRGTSDPEWCGQDGVWKEVWLARDTPPDAARVRVMRGQREALEFVTTAGVALYQEYVAYKDGKPNKRWTKAPAAMLAKCAEALALRRAFPNELAGLFSFDEMSSSYEKGAEGPKVAQPQRKSAAATKPAAQAKSDKCPEKNPWEGELDDVRLVEKAASGDDAGYKFWAIDAGGGKLSFTTDQIDIKDRAAEAMSNAKEVRIEWIKTKAGNARIETLVALQDA